jgi:hypothetical protein
MDRTGQDRTGQDRTGQDRTGQVYPIKFILVCIKGGEEREKRVACRMKPFFNFYASIKTYLSTT